MRYSLSATAEDWCLASFLAKYANNSATEHECFCSDAESTVSVHIMQSEISRGLPTAVALKTKTKNPGVP
jgi:hypothetical protein